MAKPVGMDRSLVDCFLEANEKPAEQIWIDLDATDDPIHGHQEGRFFHGYYGHCCYLPLYIFSGEHPLCARPRPANIDASAGSVEELERIVAQVRRHWPHTRIIIRGDSGFCREAIMAWCEDTGVEFVLGLAKNNRLRRFSFAARVESHLRFLRSGEPSRVFCEFDYQTGDRWSRARRVVAKAEHLAKGANPRFVVASLSAQHADARMLYEVPFHRALPGADIPHRGLRYGSGNPRRNGRRCCRVLRFQFLRRSVVAALRETDPKTWVNDERVEIR